MHNPPHHPTEDHPLRHLTTDQFMALGGNAVVYIRPISGIELHAMMDDIDLDETDDGAEFQLVVSADGSPLLVADSPEAVAEWLSDKNLGIASLQ